MAKYRKKPVVIEARQLTLDSIEEVAYWSNAIIKNRALAANRWYLVIHTLEGDHEAKIGDWIIKGVQGEFYPCKPDIFEATYEAA